MPLPYITLACSHGWAASTSRTRPDGFPEYKISELTKRQGEGILDEDLAAAADRESDGIVYGI